MIGRQSDVFSLNPDGRRDLPRRFRGGEVSSRVQSPTWGIREGCHIDTRIIRVFAAVNEFVSHEFITFTPIREVNTRIIRVSGGLS